MRTALHQCEYKHDASDHGYTFKQLHAVTTVIRSAVAVYMTFMSLQGAGLARSLRHTVNTCTVCLPCGLSCVCLDLQTD